MNSSNLPVDDSSDSNSSSGPERNRLLSSWEARDVQADVGLIEPTWRPGLFSSAEFFWWSKKRPTRPTGRDDFGFFVGLFGYIYIICVCMYMRYYGFIMVYQCLSATLDIMQRKRLYRISGIFFQPSTVNFYLVQLVISVLCVLPQGSSYGNVSPSSSTENNPISPKNTIPALTNGGETHDDVKETTNDPGLAISCAACMA